MLGEHAIPGRRTMLKLPTRLVSGTVLTILLMLTAGLVNAADPTVTFDLTIGPPPATTSFDISFVKNDIRTYILADRTNNAVDLFNASALTPPAPAKALSSIRTPQAPA